MYSITTLSCGWLKRVIQNLKIMHSYSIMQFPKTFLFFIILLIHLLSTGRHLKRISQYIGTKTFYTFPHGELLVSIPKCSSYSPHYFSLLLFSEFK